MVRIEAENYISAVDSDPANIGNAQYRTDFGVDLWNSLDVGGGYIVGSTAQGESLNYNLTVSTAGQYNIVARIASESVGPHSLGVSLNGQLLATLNFTGTGGWFNWTDTAPTVVTLTAGTYPLRLDILSNSQYNINYIDLIPVGPTGGDMTAPTATLAASPVTTGGGANHTFTVTYTDNQGIDVKTLDSNDLSITRPGPGGTILPVPVTFISSVLSGTSRVATYRAAALGGSWDTADNDTYSVAMQPDQLGGRHGGMKRSGGAGLR